MCPLTVAEARSVLDVRAWAKMAEAAEDLPEAADRPRENEAVRDIRSSRPSHRTLILDIIKAKPGIPVGELMDRLPLGGGTLYHHLTKLEQSGMIYFCIYGRRRLIYPASGRVPPDVVAATSILGGRSARRVAVAIVRRGRTSIQDLGQDIVDSPRVIYYHVQRLAQAGLVERIYENGRSDITPRPVLIAAVEALPPETVGPEGADGTVADTGDVES